LAITTLEINPINNAAKLERVKFVTNRISPKKKKNVSDLNLFLPDLWQLRDVRQALVASVKILALLQW
jgi:hypothetical protein